LGGDLQSSPQEGGLRAAASIRLACTGPEERDDFVLGEDETSAGGHEFGVFGKNVFGNIGFRDSIGRRLFD